MNRLGASTIIDVAVRVVDVVVVIKKVLVTGISISRGVAAVVIKSKTPVQGHVLAQAGASGQQHVVEYMMHFS
jgi:hypothetical protein